MANDYPDLSQPMSQSAYPDLSKPLAGSDYPDLIKDNESSKAEKPYGHNPYQMGKDIWDTIKLMSKKDMPLEKASENIGNLTMLLGPEVGGAKAFNTAKPIWNIAKQIAGSIGKTGLSSYAGASLLPGVNQEEAIGSGLFGAGLAAGLTPAAMATSSMNPLVRIGASLATGTGLGYGLGNLTGYPKTGSALGGLSGAILGTRGRNVADMAARNIADTLSPHETNLGIARNAAASHVDPNMQLSLPEATRSPGLQQMEQDALASRKAAQRSAEFYQQREVTEPRSIDSLLEEISPSADKGKVDQLLTKVKRENANVNVNRAIGYIDQQMANEPVNSEVYKTLKQAKNDLAPSANTQQERNEFVARRMPIVINAEEKINNNIARLQKNISQLEEKNKPSAFSYASDADRKALIDSRNKLVEEKNKLGIVNQAKQRLIEHGSNRPTDKMADLVQVRKNISADLDNKNVNKPLNREQRRHLVQINNHLKDAMNNVSPQYRRGQQLSSKEQTRREIDQSFDKAARSGTNFYDNILSSKENYNKLYRNLGDPNNPNVTTPAQRRLAAMKIAFHDLSENLATQAGRKTARSATNIPTGGKYELLKTILNKSYLDRYHDEVAKILYSPNWQRELEDIAKLKNGEDRGIKLARLISKVATTGIVKGNEYYKQGSEQNAIRP